MKPKGFFLAISLVCAAPVAAGQGIEDTRAYANQLFASGRYEEALPVFQRIAYFNENKDDPELWLKVADCFLASNDIDRAREYYDHAYYSEKDDSSRTEILFRKVECNLKNLDHRLALVDLLSLDDTPGAWYFRKLNFFLGIAWFGCEDFTQSGLCFVKSTPDSTVAAEIRELFANPRKFTRPDPRTASWLSVFFPGVGQFYAGEVGEGLNSLLLSGSLVGLGVLMAYFTSPLDAILTILPWFQRYYQGGMLRAANLAKEKRSAQISSIFDSTLAILSRSANQTGCHLTD